jgi:hypothetical protein
MTALKLAKALQAIGSFMKNLDSERLKALSQFIMED